MKKIFFSWLLLSAVVYVLPWLIPDIVIDSVQVALIAAAVFGIINVFLKPIVNIITLPLNLLTLGLFGIVVNAILFWLGTWLVPGFHVSTVAGVVFGSCVIALARWIIDELLSSSS